MSDKPLTIHVSEHEQTVIKQKASKEGLYLREFIPEILKAYAENPYPLDPKQVRDKTVQIAELDEHTKSTILEYAKEAGLPYASACRQIVLNAIKKE